jgi:hypothetical protein
MKAGMQGVSTEERIQLTMLDSQWNSAAEIEAVLFEIGKTIKAVQHESTWSGGYRLVLYVNLLSELDPNSGTIPIIKRPVTAKEGIVRVPTKFTECSQTGQTCWGRAHSEAKRRMNNVPFSDREKRAVLIDPRLASLVNILLPDQAADLLASAKAEFLVFENKLRRFERGVFPRSDSDNEDLEEQENGSSDEELDALFTSCASPIRRRPAEPAVAAIQRAHNALKKIYTDSRKFYKNEHGSDWLAYQRRSQSECNLEEGMYTFIAVFTLLNLLIFSMFTDFTDLFLSGADQTGKEYGVLDLLKMNLGRYFKENFVE